MWFTCFGLAEQNYELPEEVLKELGIDTAKVKCTQIHAAQINRTVPVTDVGGTSCETINMAVLCRGVFGVNKVGYAL